MKQEQELVMSEEDWKYEWFTDRYPDNNNSVQPHSGNVSATQPAPSSSRSVSKPRRLSAGPPIRGQITELAELSATGMDLEHGKRKVFPFPELVLEGPDCKQRRIDDFEPDTKPSDADAPTTEADQSQLIDKATALRQVMSLTLSLQSLRDVTARVADSEAKRMQQKTNFERQKGAFEESERLFERQKRLFEEKKRIFDAYEKMHEETEMMLGATHELLAAQSESAEKSLNEDSIKFLSSLDKNPFVDAMKEAFKGFMITFQDFYITQTSVSEEQRFEGARAQGFNDLRKWYSVHQGDAHTTWKARIASGKYEM